MTDVFIHPTAIVDEGAQIGDGTRIWHWVHICGGARIGNDCVCGQGVFIANDVIIGNNVKMQNYTSVLDGVRIEDDVFCGPGVNFTNIHNPRSAIVRKGEYRNTYVKKGATLGSGCTVLSGLTIGKHAFAGAGAVINRDVPPYALVVGVPAKQIGWMSEYGEQIPLPLSGEGTYTCPHTNTVYKLSGKNLTKVSP